MIVNGKIALNGVETEFQLQPDGTWNNWGGDTRTLGERRDLVDALASAFQDWAIENLCITCGEALLDDGEGFDGNCGNCADKAEREDEGE